MLGQALTLIHTRTRTHTHTHIHSYSYSHTQGHTLGLGTHTHTLKGTHYRAGTLGTHTHTLALKPSTQAKHPTLWCNGAWWGMVLTYGAWVFTYVHTILPDAGIRMVGHRHFRTH